MTETTAGTGAGPALGAASTAQPCDLVTVPARHGLEAVDILRLRTAVGPVLHDGRFETLGFLVPPGTAERWALPGSACTPTLSRDATAPPVTGTAWLIPPGAAAPTTDPSLLRDALAEAVRTIAAADRF